MGTKTENTPAPLTAGELTNRLLIEIPKRFTSVRVWRNNRLNAWMKGADGKFHPYSAGIDGQADISGIAKVEIPSHQSVGIRIELEVKIKDSQSIAQRAFESMIFRHGGLYLVCRDVDKAMKDLERLLRQYQEQA